MRVTLLYGFLGSGKTTLVRRIIDGWGRNQRIAVIVNEFGDLGIDSEILSANNVHMIELNSGCVCCTLRGSLVEAIEELNAKSVYEHLVVEASGIAQPGDLAETLGVPSMKENVEIDAVVTVVDTPKFDKLEKMLGEFYLAQIATADIVILNKIDLAAAQEIEQVRRKVREVNHAADIFFADRCAIDLHQLLGGSKKALHLRKQIGNGDGGPALENQGYDQNHRAHELVLAAPDVASFVLDASGNFDGASLTAFFDSLPDAVWRAKGFIVVDGKPALIQYIAGQFEIAAGQSRRNSNLVFIGRDMDCYAVEKSFKDLARRGRDCNVEGAMQGRDR